MSHTTYVPERTQSATLSHTPSLPMISSWAKFFSFSLIFFCTSCLRVPQMGEPCIEAPPHPKEVCREKRSFIVPCEFTPSPFLPLSPEEEEELWGVEYKMGLFFAEDFDFYRAITSFKRGLLLLGDESCQRALELEYFIALSYFLGNKYIDAVYVVESTPLQSVDCSFAPFNDLLLILYDSYSHLGRCAEADHIYNLIAANDPERAKKLCLLSAVKSMDGPALLELSKEKPYLETILCKYYSEKKSPALAKTLNAVFPGAGYWYIGQKQTAFTAVLMNALFIAAAIHFFDHGNVAAGVITLSFESGWYLGGICGAAMGANYYNQRLYESYAQKIAQKERFFPALMIRYSF